MAIRRPCLGRNADARAAAARDSHQPGHDQRSAWTQSKRRCIPADRQHGGGHRGQYLLMKRSVRGRRTEGVSIEWLDSSIEESDGQANFDRQSGAEPDDLYFRWIGLIVVSVPVLIVLGLVLANQPWRADPGQLISHQLHDLRKTDLVPASVFEEAGGYVCTDLRDGLGPERVFYRSQFTMDYTIGRHTGDLYGIRSAYRFVRVVVPIMCPEFEAAVRRAPRPPAPPGEDPGRRPDP